MILTKDNLLRFVREKKAVTPAMVAEVFETTTMIASAALSEIAKDNSVAITHLKLASSPYYYDPKQKECLIEIGLNYYSKYEKEVLIKLKEKEIVADNSLSIQERLAIERIKDFAFPLEISVQDRELKFWVWYLRNLDDTKRQILDAIVGGNKPSQSQNKKNDIDEAKESSKNQSQQTRKVQSEEVKKDILKKVESEFNSSSSQRSLISEDDEEEIYENEKQSSKPKFKIEENQVENFIEKYLRENYMKVESKNREEKGILYNVSLNLHKFKIEIDCFYFVKKVTEADLIKFYSSSMKPKVVFIEKCPNKLFKFVENIDNLTIVNI